MIESPRALTRGPPIHVTTGTLLVTNLAGTLANGDSFRLFEFTSRLASAFTNLILPALDPGLKWRNKLMMDGSLQLITIPTRSLT